MIPENYISMLSNEFLVTLKVLFLRVFIFILLIQMARLPTQMQIGQVARIHVALWLLCLVR